MQLNWNASSVRLVRCPIPTSYVYPVLPLSSILVLLQPVTQHRPLKVHLLSLQGLASLARIPPSCLVLQWPVNYIGSIINHASKRSSDRNDQKTQKFWILCKHLVWKCQTWQSCTVCPTNNGILPIYLLLLYYEHSPCLKMWMNWSKSALLLPLNGSSNVHNIIWKDSIPISSERLSICWSTFYRKTISV